MHHSRRKSGHLSANTSMTDVRKAGASSDAARHSKRPTTLARRTTPVSAQKLGRNPREREREWQESTSAWDDERESFPQFCATCEKQFVTYDEKFLYCSEACRKYDQNPACHDGSSRRHASNGHAGNHGPYSAEYPEPRDIIPRASPSRPSSTHFSPPTTPGATGSHGHQQYSSAMSALRSLTVQPPSPPSPTGLHPNLWPFSKSATASPGTSYNRSGSTAMYSSTYDSGYGTAAGYGHGYNYNYNYSSSGMDRPLPTRRPTGYARPKSIELVTPMVGR